MHSFLLWGPTHLSLNFNSQFLYQLKGIVYFSENCVWDFQFLITSHFFIKFLLNKKHGLFDFKTSQFLSKWKYQKSYTVFLPDLWFFSCNKKFENSMILAWVGAPQKIDLEMNFLNLENWSFEYVTFSQL